MRHAILPLQLQLFAIAVLGALLAWVVRLIRHHSLSLRDSLLWLLSTAAALAMALFPGALWWVATAIGITVPSNALFALTFVYVLVNLLSATIAISANAVRLRRVVQECTLLRAEIDAVRSRLDDVARGEPR